MDRPRNDAMSSLFASLGIARQALQAQQFGLDVTQNNITNASTEGYSRQRVNLKPGDALFQGIYQVGMGVRLESVESFRSSFLDHRVNDELQAKGEYEATSAALQQVEAIFNEAQGSGLQAALAAFFNSFGALAATPEDVSLRQQVIARGEDLATQFGQAYEQLQAIQSQQNAIISDTVSEINQLAESIAKLNVEIEAARGANTNESTLRDQRQLLLDKLGTLIDVSYFETDSGSVTVMSRQGTLIAVGDRPSPWVAGTSPAGTNLNIYAEGVDITSSLRSGKLGGLLKVRDTEIMGYLATLDDMAAGIMSKVNEQHALGADLSGVAGGDFFTAFVPIIPGSNVGAARSMTVAISDPRLIAAGVLGSGPGSNQNALALANLRDTGFLPGGANVDQYYSDFVFRIGLDTKTAVDSVETQTTMLTQLQNQRDAISAVNLDEEAINIMRYQKAYQANARFISILDQLTEELVRLIGG